MMQSQEDTVTPFQILGGEAQVVQVPYLPGLKPLVLFCSFVHFFGFMFCNISVCFFSCQIMLKPQEKVIAKPGNFHSFIFLHLL